MEGLMELAIGFLCGIALGALVLAIVGLLAAVAG